MEKDTVILSIERYEQLTSLERETLAGKTMATKVRNNYLGTTSWIPEYKMYNRDDITIIYFTNDEIVKTLTEEVNFLKDEIEKKVKLLDNITYEHRNLIQKSLSILDNTILFNRKRKINKVIDELKRSATI